ncbi:MAG: SusC/RagA family TonB-linked outer membrane protein [Chitinophagaceae bacterium]|nr:SusC/RagA family TonB-linked outer membrane protein [Chitinophagaceae bacterium]
MRKRLQLMVGLAFALLLGAQANAQTTVSGKVVNPKGDPLAAVNIQLKGTNTGTASGENGSFSLTIPSGSNRSLVFTLVGYLSQTVQVGQQTSDLLIEMKEDISNLEQVVVTGLATKIKRGNLANAVTSINAKELTGTTQIQTADGALYGKIPGANIRQNGGAPGGGLSIQLRGISALTGNANPLIIIDGVYANNDFQRTGRATITQAGASTQDDGSNRLADINPAEIENIEVLKGPSAAAIYGTRANNGVIIITTKKGAAGKTKISFNQDIGFGDPLRLLGTDDWTVEKINFFFPAARRQQEIDRLNAAIANGTKTDFEKLFYDNKATLSNTRLSISGGNEKTKFYLNGTITNEDGVVRRTGFERYSVRANIDHRISKNLSIGVNSNYLRTNTDRGFTGNQNNTGASIGYNIAYIPNYFNIKPDPVTGRYPDVDYGGPRENPLAVTDKATNNSVVNRFIMAANLDWKIFETQRSSLKAVLNGGVDYVQNTTLIHMPEDLQFQRGQANPGDVLHGKTEATNTNFQAALVFNTEVKDVSLTTQAGLVRLDFESDALFVRGRGLAPGQINVQQATVQSIDQQFFSKVSEAGVFVQQEANWQDKIIGTVGIRWDKSTNNGDYKKYYAFPKASLAANLTKMGLFDNSNVISQLKPRIAYGEAAGPVPFGTTFTSLGSTNIGGLLGSAPNTTVGNAAIEPEFATELEFGIDAGFFNNRLQFEGTYYIKRTKNNLQSLVLSPTSGFVNTTSNEAELENKGIELAVSGVVLQKKNLRWFSRLMWWKNDVITTYLGVPAYNTGAFGTALGTFAIQQGISPLTIVGTPAIPGGGVNGFTVWGLNQPDWTSSWYNTLNLPGNLEFSFLMEYRKGGDNINLTSFLTDGGGTTNGWFEDDNKDGVPNGRQRPPEPYNNAGRWVQDATFFKLREAGLFYNVPQTLTQKWFKGVVEKIRLGASGNNIFMATDYEGYDPETSTFGATTLANNVDIAPYPTTRRIFFHIGIDF